VYIAQNKTYTYSIRAFQVQ